MAVVYVPQDKRWSNLGEALGKLGGNVVSAYEDKQVAQGVQSIMQDQSVPPDQKISTITARYGTPGFNIALNQMKAGLVSQQIAASKTAQGLTQAQQTGADIANQTNLAKAPANVQQAYAQAKLTGSQDLLTQAEAANTNAKLPLIQQQVGQVAAETARTENQSKGLALENQLLVNQSALTNALASDPSKLVQSLSSQGITDPTEIARATNAAATGGIKGLQAETDKILSEHQQFASQANAAKIRANEPKDLDPQNVTFAANAAQNATAVGNFFKAFEKEPATGLATGASIKAWLESHGFSSGDPTFLQEWENQQQAIAKTATSGGGFFAQGRVNLAHDVTPNMSKSPLANIIAVDSIADQTIAELNTRLSSIATNKTRTPLENALKQWQDIKKQTGSLSSYVDTTGHSVVMYQGNQVDPSTLNIILSADKRVQFKSGFATNGALIMQQAVARKISPQEVVAQMETQYGGVVK
jgi:hypothetical protein